MASSAVNYVAFDSKNNNLDDHDRKNSGTTSTEE